MQHELRKTVLAWLGENSYFLMPRLVQSYAVLDDRLDIIGTIDLSEGNIMLHMIVDSRPPVSLVDYLTYPLIRITRAAADHPRCYLGHTCTHTGCTQCDLARQQLASIRAAGPLWLLANHAQLNYDLVTHIALILSSMATHTTA